MRATSDGTMIAAEAPATACAAMTHSTEGASTIMRADPANIATTIRNMSTQPTRWPIFAPTMTRAATVSPYTTIAVLTSVGETPNVSTMPPERHRECRDVVRHQDLGEEKPDHRDPGRAHFRVGGAVIGGPRGHGVSASR